MAVTGSTRNRLGGASRHVGSNPTPSAILAYSFVIGWDSNASPRRAISEDKPDALEGGSGRAGRKRRRRRRRSLTRSNPTPSAHGHVTPMGFAATETGCRGLAVESHPLRSWPRYADGICRDRDGMSRSGGRIPPPPLMATLRRWDLPRPRRDVAVWRSNPTPSAHGHVTPMGFAATETGCRGLAVESHPLRSWPRYADGICRDRDGMSRSGGRIPPPPLELCFVVDWPFSLKCGPGSRRISILAIRDRPAGCPDGHGWPSAEAGRDAPVLDASAAGAPAARPAATEVGEPRQVRKEAAAAAHLRVPAVHLAVGGPAAAKARNRRSRRRRGGRPTPVRNALPGVPPR